MLILPLPQVTYTYTIHTPKPSPPPSPPPPPPMSAVVDASVWRAVAGASVNVPAVHSSVYYFPEGHLEHCSGEAAAVNRTFSIETPMIPCRVLSLRFLCNRNSDEASAKIRLQPLPRGGLHLGIGEENHGGDQNNDENEIVSFTKVLTLSDANNGGGFSVPRFCADVIFPALDFAADTPVQNLTLKDTHGNAWGFRHIYRGTPRRHLLTTGWSRFVNAKRLIAGDSVVFMKRKVTGELYIGVRRARRFGEDDRQDVDEVSEVIENAGKGRVFEVVYYPRLGLPDFVVKAEKVRDALAVYWSAGMRVRMTVESEDGSRMTSYEGKIAASIVPDGGPWRGSPWRMLQVTWDEPTCEQYSNRVSPWQVECLSYTPLLDPEFHPMKKLKALPNPEGEYFFPMIEFPHSMAGHPALLNFSPFPASIQGARPNLFITKANAGRPDVSTSNDNSPRPELYISNANNDTFLQTVEQNPTNSFQLFGQIIKPDEGGSSSNTDG